MAEQVGQILAEVQATLDRYEAMLGGPFFEFGRELAACRAFQAELNAGRQRLERVARLVGSTFDGPSLKAYAATQGALQRLHEYVSAVEAQGRGSVDNTRRALDLLVLAQEELEGLLALLGVALGPLVVDPPPPPGPDMQAHVLIGLLAKEYRQEGLYNLAIGLAISTGTLNEWTPRTLARSLVLEARKRGKYQALLGRVSQERPHLFS